MQIPKPSNDEAVKKVPVNDKGVQNIIRNHSSVFQGVGKLKDRKIQLIVDKSVKPVAQQQRGRKLMLN